MHKLCVRKTAERPSFANSKHTQNMIVEEQLNTTKDRKAFIWEIVTVSWHREEDNEKP